MVSSALVFSALVCGGAWTICHVRAQASVARQLDENPKIKIEFETTLVAVGGGELLSWVSLRDERTGQVHTEKYDEGSFGVFVFVGRVPATSLVAGMLSAPSQIGRCRVP